MITFTFVYQAGITHHKKDQTWYLAPVPEDTEIRPLELKHISGPLGLWTIGILLGIVTFIIELCRQKAGNTNKALFKY